MRTSDGKDVTWMTGLVTARVDRGMAAEVQRNGKMSACLGLGHKVITQGFLPRRGLQVEILGF